jgi:hypothetical protein
MTSNGPRKRGTVRNGLLTGISTAAVSGSAAVLGVILSRKFGHGVKTDGFFAAYGVYLALILVAGTLRVVALPRFAAARADGQLGEEVATWAVALALPLLLVLIAVLAWPREIASIVTSNEAARAGAASLLPWVVVSAVAQVYGNLVASALAALDDYKWAALGFALGSIVGVATTIALLSHGVISLGWGLAVNGVVSLVVPLVPFLSSRTLRAPQGLVLARLAELAEAVSIPLALQGFYLIGLRFASGLGAGESTTFSYAYLIAAFFVAITAASLALVATVPFVREGASPERVGRYVVSVSWVSLVLVAPAAGFFACAGGEVIRRILGASYAGGPSVEIGRLVVYLAPWMVVSVAITAAFPLVFAVRRARWLPALAGLTLAADALVAWAGRAVFGLAGVAGGMALMSAFVLAGLLVALGALGSVARGVAAAAALCGAIAAAAFGLPLLLVGPVAAGVVGLILYPAAIAVLRPPGLRRSLSYVHGLR